MTSWAASASRSSESGSNRSSSAAASLLGIRRPAQQFLPELGLGLVAPVGDQQGDLLLGDVRALDPLQVAGAERLEEHVAHAQQRLRAVDVEDHPGVGLAGDGEGDARGDVGLDHAGDDVGRGTLRGHHQVDADGPRLLGQPDDVLLHLLRARPS